MNHHAQRLLTGEKMNNLSEFQQRAVSAAIEKMFAGQFFSITDLDNKVKTIGCEDNLSGRDYDALRAIHCVSWGAMDRDLKRMVREKCLELLDLPPRIIDGDAPEPENKVRLAFWRRT